MSAAQQSHRPWLGWAGTALRRAARRLGYIHSELNRANEALFRPVGAPRDWPRDSAAPARKPADAGRRAA